MINEGYKYSDLTGKIIGCAMEVHKHLGNGFQELIYQRALEREMELQGLAFVRELGMPIFYKDVQIGTRHTQIFDQTNRKIKRPVLRKSRARRGLY